jgi:ubiquinone/menaquinone biosynthesis C-methylase UbiE
MMAISISFTPGSPPKVDWYTESRFIQGGVKENEWQKYVNEAYRILKPGGWVQMGEIACASPKTDDDSLPDDAPMAEVNSPPPPTSPLHFHR